jgi:hypothetical protein
LADPFVTEGPKYFVRDGARPKEPCATVVVDEGPFACLVQMAQSLLIAHRTRLNRHEGRSPTGIPALFAVPFEHVRAGFYLMTRQAA